MSNLRTSLTRRHFLQAAGAATMASLSNWALHAEDAPANRPNFLVVLPDQLRFDWVGWNPKLPLETPHLHQLARSGVCFDRLVVASPTCAPSRACLATGVEYPRCGVDSNREDFPLHLPTFYQLLRGSGYHVMGCGKFDLHKRSHTWGVDGQHLLREWGFSAGIDNAGKWDALRSGIREPSDPYMNYLEEHSLRQDHIDDMSKRLGNRRSYLRAEATTLPEHAYCDNWIASHGIRLLREAPKGQPWFLQLNFMGPHPPNDVTKRMRESVAGRDFPMPVGHTDFSYEQMNGCLQNYAAMIENIDRWLGLFKEELQKDGSWDRTIVVYSSDHGEMLGDFNHWSKSRPSEQSIGVPLVFSGPDIVKGHMPRLLASNIDLTATFLDYAGLAVPGEMDGKSLRPVLQDGSSRHREVVYSALDPWRMVFDGRFKLTQRFNPADSRVQDPDSNVPDLLFDLEADPHETTDVMAKHPRVRRRLLEALEAFPTRPT